LFFVCFLSIERKKDLILEFYYVGKPLKEMPDEFESTENDSNSPFKYAAYMEE
jgi:hypothetical protein